MGNPFVVSPCEDRDLSNEQAVDWRPVSSELRRVMSRVHSCPRLTGIPGTVFARCATHQAVKTSLKLTQSAPLGMVDEKSDAWSYVYFSFIFPRILIIQLQSRHALAREIGNPT